MRINLRSGNTHTPTPLAMVNFATWMGEFYRPANRLTESFRDLFFMGVRTLPGVKDYILQLKFKPMSRYTEGVVIFDQEAGKAKDYPVGRMFMQPSVLLNGKLVKLDDAIGPGMAVIGVNADPSALLGARAQAALVACGAVTMVVAPSKSIAAAKTPSSAAIVVEDIHGKFRDWRMKHPAWQFIIVRPDRYVAAVCSAAELPAIVDSFLRLLQGPTEAERLAA